RFFPHFTLGTYQGVFSRVNSAGWYAPITGIGGITRNPAQHHLPLLVFNDHANRGTWVIHEMEAFDNCTIWLLNAIDMKTHVITFENGSPLQSYRQIVFIAHFFFLPMVSYATNWWISLSSVFNSSCSTCSVARLV